MVGFIVNVAKGDSDGRQTLIRTYEQFQFLHSQVHSFSLSLSLSLFPSPSFPLILLEPFLSPLRLKLTSFPSPLFLFPFSPLTPTAEEDGQYTRVAAELATGQGK